MVSCIIHVFGVLAEYALILKMIQSMKRREAEEKKKEQRELRRQIEQERRSVVSQSSYRQKSVVCTQSRERFLVPF